MNNDIFISKINKLFTDIHIIQKQTSNLVSRNVNANMMHVFKYLLKYSQKNITKKSIVSDLNFDDNVHITPSAIYSKEKHISVECCKYFSQQLYCILNDMYTFHPIMKNIERKINSSHISFNDGNIDNYVFIGVDATCSNKYKNHELITDNTIYFVDLNKKIPIIFENTTQTYFKNNKNNKSNKNHEVKTLINYLDNHCDELKAMFLNKTIVLVCDRAYHSMELFELCIKYNIKFIIRVKDNCKIFNNKKTSDKKIINYRNNNQIRKITKVHILEETVELENKQFIKTNIPIECNIVSNLEKNVIFTDDMIGNIYIARWNTEIFFKNSKNTTKLAFSPIKNDEAYEKQKYLNFIVTYLAKIIICLYYIDKYKDNEINILREHKDQYVNYSNVIYGIYKKLIDILCDGKLNSKMMSKFIKAYVSPMTSKKNRKFPRKGMIPGTKWYIKKYSDEAASKKIYNAIITNTVDKLNKNLKSTANKYITMGKKYNISEIIILLITKK